MLVTLVVATILVAALLPVDRLRSARRLHDNSLAGNAGANVKAAGMGEIAGNRLADGRWGIVLSDNPGRVAVTQNVIGGSAQHLVFLTASTSAARAVLVQNTIGSAAARRRPGTPRRSSSWRPTTSSCTTTSSPTRGRRRRRLDRHQRHRAHRAPAVGHELVGGERRPVAAPGAQRQPRDAGDLARADGAGRPQPHVVGADARRRPARDLDELGRPSRRQPRPRHRPSPVSRDRRPDRSTTARTTRSR